MGELSNRNFGLLIAYVVPGFVLLCGTAFPFPPVRDWLLGAGTDGPSLGGVLYVLIASVAAGMTASAVRWAVIDTFHHRTGLTHPAWDDRHLHERTQAYVWIVENHYRYYQFYGNTAVALVLAWAFWRGSLVDPARGVGWVDVSVSIVALVFLAGSRSALSRYYRRTHALLSEPVSDKEFDHDQRRSPQAPSHVHQAGGQAQAHRIHRRRRRSPAAR
ncbi:MAG: hypothetical protein AAGI30_08295 [Planctomycetota bacterium]